jgi:hypothetical protein
LFSLFAKYLHVQVAVGLDPVLVDFDRKRPNQSQGTFLIREDSDDMGSTFELLVKPLEHIGALEMLVVPSGQSVKKSRSPQCSLFNPRAKFWVFLLPAKQPGRRQISASFPDVAPVVKPSQFH